MENLRILDFGKTKLHDWQLFYTGTIGTVRIVTDLEVPLNVNAERSTHNARKQLFYSRTFRTFTDLLRGTFAEG